MDRENVLLSVCKIIGALIILLTINVPLTMVLFALVIIMALFSLFLNYGMKRIFKENREKISQVNMQLLDTLAGIRVVKAFANEALEREKFHKSNEAFGIQKAFFSYIGEISIRKLLFAGNAVCGGYWIRRYIYSYRTDYGYGFGIVCAVYQCVHQSGQYSY